ncbi:hypothetical protein V2J09_022722 [Rumex salicifolius]
MDAITALQLHILRPYQVDGLSRTLMEHPRATRAELKADDKGISMKTFAFIDGFSHQHCPSS